MRDQEKTRRSSMKNRCPKCLFLHNDLCLVKHPDCDEPMSSLVTVFFHPMHIPDAPEACKKCNVLTRDTIGGDEMCGRLFAGNGSDDNCIVWC